jgi:release factor glutamine methyltransferase
MQVTSTVFHDVELETRPGLVMTPRPATEHLVDRALDLVGDSRATIADVGTGSGAIAVVLAVGAPRAEVWATDVSAEAAELARRNAIRQGVADRVHVVLGDLLGPVPAPLDLVVANLPYLPWGVRGAPEYADLADEPPAALFAAQGGLEPYCRLLDQARDRLRPRGRLLVQYRARMLEAAVEDLGAIRRELGVGIPVAA